MTIYPIYIIFMIHIHHLDDIYFISFVYTVPEYTVPEYTVPEYTVPERLHSNILPSKTSICSQLKMNEPMRFGSPKPLGSGESNFCSSGEPDKSCCPS